MQTSRRVSVVVKQVLEFTTELWRINLVVLFSLGAYVAFCANESPNAVMGGKPNLSTSDVPQVCAPLFSKPKLQVQGTKAQRRYSEWIKAVAG